MNHGTDHRDILPYNIALELLDGTLKLRHCIILFTMRFPLGLYLGLENGGGKKQSDTPGHLLDESSDTGRRVRQTRKTRPGASAHVIPDPGHPTPSLDGTKQTALHRRDEHSQADL